MRRLSWATLRDEARTRLWPLPVLGIAVALGFGVALPRLDEAVGDDLPAWLTAYLFSGGPDAARSVLATVATSLISVTSLTFSLTVVTLQLASSQYSPRLLRTFTSDRFVHLTLGLFLSSFTYALTVLRKVRTADGAQDAFVPQISVTIAFVMALASVLGLVLFLAHLAREIRVETILRNVHEDATRTINAILPDTEASNPPGTFPVPPLSGVRTLLAPRSGFLVGVDSRRLLDATVSADAVVLIDTWVGSPLVQGTPMGIAWSHSDHELSDPAIEALEEGLAQCLGTGFERTAGQDVGFGLRQLTDVANKALSPGINDPTTAVHVLNHSAAVLCDLARRRVVPEVLTDDAGTPRLVLARQSFADLLGLAVTQPSQYGAADPAVAAALLELLASVAWVADDPADRDAVAAQLSVLHDHIDDAAHDAERRAVLARLESRVTQSLERPRPVLPR